MLLPCFAACTTHLWFRNRHQKGTVRRCRGWTKGERETIPRALLFYCDGQHRRLVVQSPWFRGSQISLE